MLKKVKETIKRKDLLRSGDRVLVGVSGGPDSICLLHILSLLRDELNFSLFAAHLDHGLRPESGKEARFVRALAGKWSIPVYTSMANVSLYKKNRGLSSQEAARRLRYHFFWKAALFFKANKIALGQHRDDQVETVLINFLAGAGLDGLSGIKISRPLKNITIIRPLIKSSRREIEKYCKDHHLETLTDASNLKPVYRRNKVRLELIPYLEREYNPRIRESLYRMSEILSGELAYLHKKAVLYLRLLSKPRHKGLWVDSSALSKLHISLQRRVIKLAVQKAGKYSQGPGSHHIEAVIKLYQNEGKTGKQLSLPGLIDVYMDSDGLVISGKDHNRFVGEPVTLNVPGLTLHPGSGMIIEAEKKNPGESAWPPDDKTEAYLDLSSLQLPLVLSTRWEGARFRPLGLKGKSKKLKDYFIDRKIPRRERKTYPLIVSGNEIVWVISQSIAYPFRVKDDTREVLVLKIKHK